MNIYGRVDDFVIQEGCYKHLTSGNTWNILSYKNIFGNEEDTKILLKEKKLIENIKSIQSGD